MIGDHDIHLGAQTAAAKAFGKPPALCAVRSFKAHDLRIHKTADRARRIDQLNSQKARHISGAAS